MFTGLIQSIAVVTHLKGRQLQIETRLPKPTLGESIALNGVCLTVKKMKKKKEIWVLDFDLSPETIRKTSFSKLKTSSAVNVERCVTLNSFLGGHLVQGHVDGVGKVHSIRALQDNKEIVFNAPKNVMTYVVPKGSITVNGVSLTAVNVTKSSFSVALIPFSLKHTNLGSLRVGDPVNLEVDVLAKYVEKLVKKR